MKIGTLTSHILHRASKDNIDYYYLKSNDDKNIIVQLEKNNKVIYRRKMNKEAVGIGGFPKAFDKDSPSNNLWRKTPSSDGGGNLSHFPLHNKNKYRQNRNAPKDKTDMGTEQEWWYTPEMKEDDSFPFHSRVRTDFQRDDGSDRPGFSDAEGRHEEGFRPPIPVGEDSLDLARKPQEYNPNYDHGYGTDDFRDYETRARYNEEKVKIKERQNKSLEDGYRILYEDNGVNKTSNPMTFERVLKIKKDHPGAVVKKSANNEIGKKKNG